MFTKQPPDGNQGTLKDVSVLLEKENVVAKVTKFGLEAVMQQPC